jgi:hypothetical protein
MTCLYFDITFRLQKDEDGIDGDLALDGRDSLEETVIVI